MRAKWSTAKIRVAGGGGKDKLVGAERMAVANALPPTCFLASGRSGTTRM